LAFGSWPLAQTWYVSQNGGNLDCGRMCNKCYNPRRYWGNQPLAASFQLKTNFSAVAGSATLSAANEVAGQ